MRCHEMERPIWLVEVSPALGVTVLKTLSCMVNKITLDGEQLASWRSQLAFVNEFWPE